MWNKPYLRSVGVRIASTGDFHARRSSCSAGYFPPSNTMKNRIVISISKANLGIPRLFEQFTYTLIDPLL